MRSARFRATALPVLCASIVLAGAAGPAGAAPPATPPGLGAFVVNGTAVDGAFVQFEIPGTEGTVLVNFSSAGAAFFPSVAVTNYSLRSAEAAGSTFRLLGTTAETTVHDNPNAIMKLQLDAGTVATFVVDGNLDMLAANNSSLSLAVAGTNRTGTVWWTCGDDALTLAADGGSFDVAAPTASCFVFFRSHVESSPSDLRIGEAAGARRVTAEVWVGSAPRFDAASYGPAKVFVGRDHDAIVLGVDAGGGGPQSVVVRFVAPPGGVPAAVTVDGTQATPADDVSDALDAADGETTAEYAVGYTPEGNALMVVFLPDGAPHTIRISVGAAPTVADTSPSLLGASAGLVAAAVAAVILLGRRR